ncbi:MAG: hypothetical protein J0L57_01400 [Burkholderiales bacterium]|nr:hypothetical protein [Burkholderiales bacterium]
MASGLAPLLLPVAAPAQAAAATGLARNAEAKPDARRWNAAWTDWRGLSFDSSLPIEARAPDTGSSPFDLDEVRFSGLLGGRLEIDGAAYTTGGSLTGFDDGFDLRRARVTLKGAGKLTLPFGYSVELDYSPGSFNVTEAYLSFPTLLDFGDLQFGQFTPPVGLQTFTSSWDIGFMEPAAPLTALVPQPQPGAQLTGTHGDRRGSWAIGAYVGLRSDGQYGSSGQGVGSTMGRATWLAVDAIEPQRPRENRLLHLGASGVLQFAADGEIRYRSRPESHNAPYVIDTGTIAATRAGTLGLEMLWVDARFSAQGEVMLSRVEDASGQTLRFGGLYAQASWYLTGESRPYDTAQGKPGRLVPRSNFGFGPGAGWGALEAGARVSYTDLEDGSVQGGRLAMLMTTLNWYLRPQLKLAFELGTGRVAGKPLDGNGRLVVGQLRLGTYFY